MLYKALSRLAVFLSVLPMFAIGQTTTPIITTAPLDPNWDYSLYVPKTNSNPNGAYIDNFTYADSLNQLIWPNYTCPTCFWTDQLSTTQYNNVQPTCLQPSQAKIVTVQSGQTSTASMVGQTALALTIANATGASNPCGPPDSLISGGLISTNTFGPYGFYSTTMQLASGQLIDDGPWMQAPNQTFESVNIEVVNTAEWSEPANASPYPLNLLLCETSNELESSYPPNPPNKTIPTLQTQFRSDPPSNPDLGTTFNTFAWDWEPNYITYYLNGTPLVTYTNNSPYTNPNTLIQPAVPTQPIPQVPMNIWLSNGWNTTYVNPSINKFQGTMFVSNFSMYHLKKGSCNNLPIMFTSNQDITNYGNPNSYAVQNAITFNGNIDFDYCALPQGAPTPAGFNFVFRAVNSITINKGNGNTFTAGASGSSAAHTKTPLVLMPTGCIQ